MIETHRRARSAGAQSALGSKPAVETIYRPALRHLADRVGSRLRTKQLAGRTITARIRFADMRAITRSITLPAPVSATAIISEVAEELVGIALTEHSHERVITLLAVSVSHLERQPEIQLELSWGAAGEAHRPGTRQGAARWSADRAMDRIRERFGWDAVGYASVVLEGKRSIPDAFRELAEKDL